MRLQSCGDGQSPAGAGPRSAAGGLPRHACSGVFARGSRRALPAPEPGAPGRRAICAGCRPAHAARERHIERSRLAIAAIVLAAAGLVVFAGSGAAQSIRQDLWVTDGTVNAVARSGNTLYIGGAFGRLGPPTGGGAPLDSNGVVLSGFAK